MQNIKNFFVIFFNLTWGIIQTLAGALTFLVVCWGKKKIFHKGSIVTEIPGHWGGITLGMFVFVCYMPTDKEIAHKNKTIMHENGHTLQSALLGPLWLFIIAVPSLIWAGCFGEYRNKHNISYYSLYTEAWADAWGGVVR